MGRVKAGWRTRACGTHVAERAPVDPAASYRVTVNNFLVVGGDGFTVLTQGTAPLIASTIPMRCMPILGRTARRPGPPPIASSRVN